jgi:hypothetical protein
MSDHNQSELGTRGCAAAFLIMLGAIMLLPGLCFMAIGRGGSGGNNFSVVGLLMMLGPAALIAYALGMLTPKRPPPQSPQAGTIAAEPDGPAAALDAPRRRDKTHSGDMSNTLIAILLLSGLLLFVLWLMPKQP